jgi:DNA-binding response OmpR family regulator
MKIQELQKKPRRKPHVVVVDDDPVFGRLMVGFGAQQGFDITYCHTMEAASCLERESVDVLVMDYDMGVTTGIQLATEAEHKTAAPIILISSTQDALTTAGWPSSVVGFVSKSAGPRAIIIAALQAYSETNRAPRPDFIPPVLANAF